VIIDVEKIKKLDENLKIIIIGCAMRLLSRPTNGSFGRLSVWQRRRQGSPFHSLTAIQTPSQPKKNPRLRNGWFGELTNGMEASHTVIQTAMVAQPRQSIGRLAPKTGLGPNQYRGLSAEILRVECSLDLAVLVIPNNVAGARLIGDLRDSNYVYLLFGSE
jgi:hypothetical protein